MTTRLTPEREAEIKRRAQFANVPDDIRALLAEIDALRRIASEAIGREMNLLQAALNALRDAGIPEAPQGFNAPQAVILGIGLLRRQLEDAKAGLVWSDELPTEEGWYWYRFGVNGNLPEAVEVWLGDHDGELRVSRIGSSPYDDDELLSSYGGSQWAGPLVPPETGA